MFILIEVIYLSRYTIKGALFHIVPFNHVVNLALGYDFVYPILIFFWGGGIPTPGYLRIKCTNNVVIYMFIIGQLFEPDPMEKF